MSEEESSEMNRVSEERKSQGGRKGSSGQCRPSQLSSLEFIPCNKEDNANPSRPSVVGNFGKGGYDTSSSFINFLQGVRDTLARHQEKRGISPNEQFGFFKLICTIVQNSVGAFIGIFIMFYNLVPLLECLLYLLRFILDKTIEISETESTGMVAVKIIVFIFETAIITLLIMIICSFILIPVLYMFNNIYGQLKEVFFSEKVEEK